MKESRKETGKPTKDKARQVDSALRQFFITECHCFPGSIVESQNNQHYISTLKYRCEIILKTNK